MHFNSVAILMKWLLAGLGLAILLSLLALYWLRFPEHDYSLVVPALSPAERELVTNLEAHVRRLASAIGPRNVARHPRALTEAASYIESRWTDFGYKVVRQTVESQRGVSDNLFIDLPGADPALPEIVIGAHYDSFGDAPGANDNATGVAAMIELSRILRAAGMKRSLRFVAFTNEEPPEYRTYGMGSVAYVREFGSRPTAMMLSLETIGYYVKDPGSQQYPWPMELLYPSVGDFVGFVGDLASRPLTREIIESFRRVSNFPAGAVTLPDWIEGMGWSDHWAFWAKGIPAVMVTDSAVFRYGYYHTRDDTMDKINFDDLARVVTALKGVLTDPGFDAAKPYGFTGR